MCLGEHIYNYTQNANRYYKNNEIIIHICLTGALSIFMRNIFLGVDFELRVKIYDKNT